MRNHEIAMSEIDSKCLFANLPYVDLITSFLLTFHHQKRSNDFLLPFYIYLYALDKYF